MSTWIRVLDERPNGYPRGGTVYSAGSVLPVPDAAAVAACDEASPPFAERLSEDEVNDLTVPEPDEDEETAPEPPNVKFSPAALDRLQAHDIAPQEYDGEQTGARDQAVVEDVERWLVERDVGAPLPAEETDELLEDVEDEAPDGDEEA